MSVTPTDDDSTDYEASGKTNFDREVESLLGDLSERFQEHSKKFVANEKHNTQMVILIPETPFVDEGGRESGRILMSKNIRTAKEHGFSLHAVGNSRNGVGVSFWFSYDE